jgi:mRNA-degrading endonuclease RelE of RelBE toxin-antitoxin system
LTWQILVTDVAKKQLRKIKDTPKLPLFEKAIQALAESGDPAVLGTFKQGSNFRCYAYNVTKSLRLLYSVDREKHLIIIKRLGDHKETYGED